MSRPPAITDPAFVEKMQARREDGWTDKDYERIDEWRAAQGEAIMTDWHWWAGPGGDELYENELPSRDAAIAWGRKEYHPRRDFTIIEARCWQDDLAEDEEVPFAASRNKEIILMSDAS